MCTRFYIGASEELTSYIDTARKSPLAAKMSVTLNRQFKNSGEVQPTDMTAVIATGKDGKQTVFPMIWGYHIGGIRQPIVNARVESAKEKRTFATDWQKHRCIIPASYYFEWEHIKRPDGKMITGQKFAIKPQRSAVTWLAGLYRIEKEQELYYPVFTVLTREPTKELAKIHNRMPVILPESAVHEWICPDGNPENIVKTALTDVKMETAK